MRLKTGRRLRKRQKRFRWEAKSVNPCQIKTRTQCGEGSKAHSTLDGELFRPSLSAFYKHNKISYTTEQTSDVLLTAKGIFEQLSLLLFFTQNENHKIGLLLKKVA